MRIDPFVYLEPKSLNEALSMLDRYKEKLRVLSGGTELIALMKLRLARPEYVMSLKNLPALRGIREFKGKVVIGGATTLTEIIESPVMKSLYKGVVEAAQAVAAPHIQNVATIAGNILQDTRCLFYNQSELVTGGLAPCFKLKGNYCRVVKGSKRCFSVYQGDLAPALIAFNGTARLERKSGQRTMLLSELFSGNGKEPSNLEKDELLTKIILPLPKKESGSAYRKFRLRGSIDYPLASVASVVSVDRKGALSDCSVVIGAAGPAPKPVPEVSLLMGKRPNSDNIQAVCEAAFKIAEGVDNQLMSGLYRRKVIKVLTRRALENSLHDIGGVQ